MSTILQRFKLSNMLGKLFGGRRDLYDVFGYTKTITYSAAYARYRRQDIAARVLDALPNALWTNPPIITSTNAEWNKVWQDLAVNRGLWDAISRVDRMCGMGDFACLLVGMDQTRKLELPAGMAEGRKVLYFQPYCIEALQIETINQNAANPRYLMPETYRVSPSENEESITSNSWRAKMGKLAAFTVHESRMLHVAENCLTDSVFGNPRIERIWNLLDDILKVAGGSAETFWLISNRGMQIDVDKEMELSPEDEQNLTDEVNEYFNNLRRFIRTRGVKVNTLGADSPDPKNTFDVLISLLSGATGIPKRILLGSEAGQLASGEDRNNWAERIEERRKSFGEPVIIWPLIRLLTNAGVLPGGADIKISIVWPDAFQLTPLEKGQTAAQFARTASNLAKAMTEQAQLVKIDEARTIMGLGTPKIETTAEVITQVNAEK